MAAAAAVDVLIPTCNRPAALAVTLTSLCAQTLGGLRGEDVLVQCRVMARYGGCGLIPSGAYHQELPTTVAERRIDAPFALADDRDG
ncbi:MAG: hypothetical protein ACOZCP_05155 [Pseudomonadota bacterium]